MLEFRDIAITDKNKICTALKKSDFMGCEYSFANNMAWKRLADSKICFYKNFYICGAFNTDDNAPHFILPAGSGDYCDVINELKNFSNSLNKPLVLTGVTENSLKMLGELFPDAFTAEYDRDSSDYIYDSQKFITLQGKNNHGKRNHLARFMELSPVYSPVTDNDIDDCITFCTKEYNDRSDNADHSFIAEQYAINTYFSYFHELGLSAGLIRINGNIAAVSIGEQLNSDTFCVHIEKADTHYNGIYTGIANLFAKNNAAGFKYINREEDLGLEGLRKSKLSYHPEFLLNKYIVTFK